MNTAVSRVYFVFTVCTGFLVVAVFLSRKKPAGISCVLEVPEFTTAGETVPLRVTLHYSGNASFNNMGIGLGYLPPDMIIEHSGETRRHVSFTAGAEDQTVEWSISCTRRGVYLVGDIVLETYDPFGLMRNVVVLPVKKRVVVYPRFYPLRTMSLSVGRRYHPGGVCLTSNVGDSSEFFSIREYRDGDDVSKMHWKSWARHGKPIVKEFQEEYFVRIALILDTHLSGLAQPGTEQKFEYAVSLAASITSYFSQNEYLVDLFAAGDQLYHLTSGRNLAFQEQILEILACVEQSETNMFFEIKYRLVPALRNTTSVILILLEWDDLRRELVEELMESDSAIKVILLSPDPEFAEGAYLHNRNFSCHYIDALGDPSFVEDL